MIDLCQRKLKQTKKQVELDFVESSRSYIVNPPMKEIANPFLKSEYFEISNGIIFVSNPDFVRLYIFLIFQTDLKPFA
jgi:hypothetical protein